MHEKKVPSRIVSNFEINPNQNKVLFYISPKIFSSEIVKRAASHFKDKVWVSIDGDDEELLVELKPMQESDLELLGREFNNVLLEESLEGAQIDSKNDSLVSRIRNVVNEFVKEQEGRISKQSVIAISALLAGIGIAGYGTQNVTASHLCACVSCCFKPDQLVLTPQGLIEIKDVKVGAQVISYDEKTGEKVISKVKRIFVHDGKKEPIGSFAHIPLINLRVESNGKVIETKVTENHLYFDPVSNDYRRLLHFNLGERIKTADGEGIIVGKEPVVDSKSSIEMHSQVVYDLEMETSPHNYFVNHAVVHNGGCGGTEGAEGEGEGEGEGDGEGGEGGEAGEACGAEACGCACFLMNEKVLTPVGEVPIQDILPGMEVLSYDEGSDFFLASTVEKVMVHDGKQLNYANFAKDALVELAVKVGSDIIKTKVTVNHRFLDASSKHYKQLRRFASGDTLQTEHGVGTIISMAPLIDVSTENQGSVVYNLEMSAAPHNYLVNGIVVHNGK